MVFRSKVSRSPISRILENRKVSFDVSSERRTDRWPTSVEHFCSEKLFPFEQLLSEKHFSLFGHPSSSVLLFSTSFLRLRCLPVFRTDNCRPPSSSLRSRWCSEEFGRRCRPGRRPGRRNRKRLFLSGPFPLWRAAAVCERRIFRVGFPRWTCPPAAVAAAVVAVAFVQRREPLLFWSVWQECLSAEKTNIIYKVSVLVLENYISRRLVSCLNFKLFSLEGTFHRR